MTTPALSTIAGDALELIDRVVRPLQQPGAAGTASVRGITPAETPAGIELRERLEDLRTYAGPVITAPLEAPIRRVIDELRLLELERDHADTLDQQVAARNATISDLLDVIGHARYTIGVLGRTYVARDRQAVEAELHVEELEALLIAEGQSSGRRLTPGMAASRLREARKRAARKAEELITAELDDALEAAGLPVPPAQP